MIGTLLRPVINLAVAGAIGVTAYNHRDAILAFLDDAAPMAAPATVDSSAAPSRTLRLRADPRGHFFVFAHVDGTPVRFLVDTGATGIVLTPEDAARIGLRPRERDFTETFHTANGIVRAAPVTLREISIGALSVRQVEAVVNERPIGVSLLGMTFLRRLDGYSVQNGELVLSW